MLLDTALLVNSTVAIVILLAPEDLETFFNYLKLGVFLFEFGCCFSEALRMLRVLTLPAVGFLLCCLSLFHYLHLFNFIYLIDLIFINLFEFRFRI